MFWNLYFGTIVFLIGLAMGSFFNVCIYRIPAGISIVTPPSHCTVCNHRLSSLDLIPVISLLFLKGKCRYCHAKVSYRYLLVEILTAALFLFTYFRLGISIELVVFIIFISLLILIAFIDFDHQIIPDRFVVIGFVLSLSYLFLPLISHLNFSHALFSGFNEIDGFSDLPFKSALFGGLVGTGSLLAADIAGRFIFKKESMGFGDVKLMAWVGIFLGLKGVIVALLFAVWTGALVGVFLLRIRRFQNDDNRYMPFGPFLAIGSLISAFFAGDIVNWYLGLM